MDDKRLSYLWARISQPGDRDETWWLDWLEYHLTDGSTLKGDDLLQHETESEAVTALLEPKRWAEWVRRSESDLRAWEVVQKIVESLRRHYPKALKGPPLWDWVLDVATGSRREPKPSRGRKPGKNRERDLLMVKTVYAIRRLGDRPAESSSDGKSVCHIVASRVHLSYEAVRTIWRKPEYEMYRKKQLSPARDVLIAAATLQPDIEWLKDWRLRQNWWATGSTEH